MTQDDIIAGVLILMIGGYLFWLMNQWGITIVDLLNYMFGELEDDDN